jgi:hypothetical protein
MYRPFLGTGCFDHTRKRRGTFFRSGCKFLPRQPKSSSFKYPYFDLFMLGHRVTLKFAVRPHAYVGRLIPHIVTEPDVSLSCSQQPGDSSYSDRSKPSPYSPPHFFKTRQQSAILTRGLIPSYFRPLRYMKFPYLPRALDPQSITSSFIIRIWLGIQTMRLFLLWCNSPKPA